MQQPERQVAVTLSILIHGITAKPLMNHDRSSSELLPLTHQLLADMLGVHRSAVTIAAGKLQRKKLIGYSRGQIRILSRTGLEEASCECYGMQISDDVLQLTV